VLAAVSGGAGINCFLDVDFFSVWNCCYSSIRF